MWSGCHYGVRWRSAASENEGGGIPKNVYSSLSRRREDNFEKAKAYIERGDNDAGMKRMVDSIDVSPDVAHKLILALRDNDIKFIVAPY